jgi:glutamate synthase (NADPH/NADH) small chain
MEFLIQQNKRIAHEYLRNLAPITAQDKRVIVLGGGDTGSDCIGTSIRQGARWVTQFEILPQPPAQENKLMTWPNWPLKLMTSSSQEEGCRREWTVATKRFLGEDDRVTGLEAVRVEWRKDDSGRMVMEEVPGSTFVVKADLVLLAMGFVHPVHEGMLKEIGIGLNARGNVDANTQDYRTSVDKVFTAGDMRRGQSLVVWAIREGRQCARAVDEYLMGASVLPR